MASENSLADVSQMLGENGSYLASQVNEIGHLVDALGSSYGIVMGPGSVDKEMPYPQTVAGKLANVLDVNESTKLMLDKIVSALRATLGVEDGEAVQPKRSR